MELSHVILLTLICQVAADNPYVRITETDPPIDPIAKEIIQKKTKDIQLTCTVENKPIESEVQWVMQSGDSNEIQISMATRSFDAYKWSIDKPTSTAWRLRVQNAEESDEGTYTCKISVSTNTYNTDARDVKIVELPQISDLTTSNDMDKNEGTTATFECYAGGRPTPLVKWTRLAGELLPNGGTEFIGNVLEIDDVSSDHAGIYKCTASNSAGYDEKNIRLTVSFAPEVDRAVSVVRQKEGHPTVLSCSVKGFPLPSLKDVNWIHDNRPILSGGRFEIRNIEGAYNKISTRLMINPVTQEDYGMYRCEAKNDKGGDFAAMNLESSSIVIESGYQFGAATSPTISVACVLVGVVGWLVGH